MNRLQQFDWHSVYLQFVDLLFLHVFMYSSSSAAYVCLLFVDVINSLIAPVPLAILMNLAGVISITLLVAVDYLYDRK
jgi:hypothetical protein